MNATNPSKSEPKEFQFGVRALLPIAAMCFAAISHPIYDLLVRGDHATFFVAHESKAIDIYLLVIVLSVALPLVIFLGLWFLNRLSKRLGRAMLTLVMFALFILLFTPASTKLFGDLGWGNIAIGAGVAAACTLLFVQASWPRQLLSLLAIGALISPVMFLANPVIRGFLSTPEAQDFKFEGFSKRYPDIVMLVFDEFPLISLLDENRQIDAVRYPNFARLARTSTWYRNTVTPHTTTPKAVPEILTGRYVNERKPVAGAEGFPDSLVSFLRPTHQLRGVEIVTTFFDHTENQDLAPNLRTRFTRLGTDLGVVFGHEVLPESLDLGLPSIDSQWSDFRAPEPDVLGMKATRPLSVRKFIDLLKTTPKTIPAFYFVHLLLPHSPLRFNDDGRSIGNELEGYGLGTRSPTPHTFSKNEQDSLLIFQAHLLQTRFVDLILGDILDELERQGIFDDSLIVVTADHGIGYIWYENTPADLVTLRAGEVYWVPFFLKKPGQQKGEIVDENVVTVDIFPTIADILGRKIPWAVDGISTIGPSARRDARQGTGNPDTRETWLPVGKQTFEALDTQIALFGQHDLGDLYFYGPHRELIGHGVKSLPMVPQNPPPGVVRILTPSEVDPSNRRVPFYLKGEFTPAEPGFRAGAFELAIAINGTVRQTARLTRRMDRLTFTTRIPTEAWNTGKNSIAVYALREDVNGQGVSLTPLPETETQ